MSRSIIYILTICLAMGCKNAPKVTDDLSHETALSTGTLSLYADLLRQESEIIIALADRYLLQKPVPLTSSSCPRSAGGIHDFYSEGDYWWQNPADPAGPYIRRDGQSNPSNFADHRMAMRNLNRWVSTLVAAYKITQDERYAVHALVHLDAFFLNENTYMTPHLLYAQAITGRVTGRGIGIIDTIHLIETAKAIGVLAELGFLKGQQLAGLKSWFNQYVDWLTTHQYGLDEKDHGNNHSTWWAAQVAAFAQLAGRDDLLEVAKLQFKKLLPVQMAADGSFPEEMSRTKPYSYTLFNLEGYAVLSQIASTVDDNLWTYTKDNKSLLKGWQFMVPFMKDKSTWTKPPDIQHFNELPIRSPGFLFAAKAYDSEDFLTVWKSLSPKRKSEEVIRTYPLWNPILWIGN